MPSRIRIPPGWADDLFPFPTAQILRPPGKSGVGNDEMMATIHQAKLLPHRVVTPLIIAWEPLCLHMGTHPLYVVGKEDEHRIVHPAANGTESLLVIFRRTDMEVLPESITKIVAAPHTDTNAVGTRDDVIKFLIMRQRRVPGCELL